jgi:hypothetical protein
MAHEINKESEATQQQLVSEQQSASLTQRRHETGQSYFEQDCLKLYVCLNSFPSLKMPQSARMGQVLLRVLGAQGERLICMHHL